MSSDRPYWYSDHPPACTCAQCSDRRMNKVGFGKKVSRFFKKLKPRFGKRKKRGS